MSEPTDAALRDFLAAAWPPAIMQARDGWLLRATPGVSRGRLNSGLPLTPDPPLAAVEAFYAELGLPAQVQLTPLDGHPAVTAELDVRGWRARWPSTVLIGPAALPAPAVAIELRSAPDDDWLAAWGATEGRDEADVRAHADTVMAQLDGHAAYAIQPSATPSASRSPATSCAACSASRRIRIAAAAGLGAAVVAALAGWARERGARRLCLEVEQRNAPALALYARLGFTRRYDYLHRVAP